MNAVEISHVSNSGTMLSANQLPDEVLEDAAFFAKDAAWAAIVQLFDDMHADDVVSYTKLAGRIGRSRSQVHRWLNSSSNITLQSLGLLAAGLDAEISISVTRNAKPLSGRNYCHPAEDAKALVKCGLVGQPRSVVYDSHQEPDIPMTEYRLKRTKVSEPA